MSGIVPALATTRRWAPSRGRTTPAEPVPGEPRAELRELVARVAAGQHVQHALELGAGERGEGSGPAHERVELVRLAIAEGHRGHELLREHVQGIPGDARLLDCALLHRLSDRRARQEVAPELREDDAARDRLHLVARPADALHAARHRGRRLDLDHEVHRPHVDPQLERRGGHDRGSRPALSASSISTRSSRAIDPWWARATPSPPSSLRAAAIRSASRRLFTKMMVERWARDELKQTRVDGGPDRPPLREAGDPPASLVLRGHGLAQTRHVLHRHLDAQVEGLAGARVHDRDGARPPRARAFSAPEVAGHLLERPLRGGESDAHERPARRLLEPLQGECQVRAPLGAHERVDLVHDHGLHRRQDLPGPRREDQEERLRGRDQDVGRLPEHAGPFVRGSVARPDGEGREVPRLAAPGRHARDPRHRRPQVALHVHGQCLQGRDVDDAAPLPFRRHGREHQPVDGGQERGEGLPRPGGGEDERGAALTERGPPELLGAGGARERLAEPVLDGGVERR